MKYLRIKDIVHSISETHKLQDKELYAINTSDIENGVIIQPPLSKTETLKGQFKKTVQQNDILFSEIRPANRRFAKVIIKNCNRYVISTKLMVLRKFNNDVDLDYFYYYITNQSFLEILQRRAENRIGSFPQITFDLLSEYIIPIPELNIQKKIAKIISTLDQKINQSNSINHNLLRPDHSLKEVAVRHAA